MYAYLNIHVCTLEHLPLHLPPLKKGMGRLVDTICPPEQPQQLVYSAIIEMSVRSLHSPACPGTQSSACLCFQTAGISGVRRLD